MAELRFIILGCVFSQPFSLYFLIVYVFGTDFCVRVGRVAVMHHLGALIWCQGPILVSEGDSRGEVMIDGFSHGPVPTTFGCSLCR